MKYTGNIQKYDSKLNYYMLDDGSNDLFIVGNNDYAMQCDYDSNTGELTIIIYDKNGNEISKDTIKSVGYVNFPECRNSIYSSSPDGGLNPFDIITEYTNYSSPDFGGPSFSFSNSGSILITIVGCTAFINKVGEF